MRKHFILLSAPAYVDSVFRTPNDGVLTVSEGEMKRVTGLGVADDVTDDFAEEHFPASEDAEADAETAAPDPQKPSVAKTPRKKKGN